MKRNVKEIIDFADELRENTYSCEMKASWLNEAETLILSEIHNIAPYDITPVIPYEEHKNDELTLDVTRDKIYILYLTAMIDFADKEYAGYNNSIALFNEQLDTYAKWYVRTHKAGEPLISGMYLSAYGIAVSHGYTGTEEEWLLSLKGEKGEKGEKSEKGDTGEAGKTPVKGVGYFTDSEVEEILKSAAASVKVDSNLSEESENAIQNKAVATALKLKQDKIDELKGDLVNAIDYVEVDNVIAIDAKAGYFATGNGYLNWTADINRKSAIVTIDNSKRYKLTTNIRSAAIYGLICIRADNPTPEKLFYCTILDKKYQGNGTNQVISEEIVIPDGCTHIVIQSTNLTEPVLCEIDEMPVFRAYTKDESDMRYAQIACAVNPHMVTDLAIHVGDDITATPVMGSGWTSTETNSYTHAANGAGDLSLEFSGDVGSVYLVEFDTSFTGGEFVRVGIGTGYRVLAYNGTNHIVLPLTAYSNTTLYITPYASGINTEFTISGLKIRKIQDAGDEVILTLNSVYTDNHHVAYGFWNVLLGNSAPNSSASTRTVAIGHNALSNLQGGHRNVAIGTFALSKLIGGENNIAIGSDSLYLVEYANNNLSIGNWSMQHAEGATECIAIGQYALEKCRASRNVAIGGLAGGSLSGTSAWKNTYVGYRAGTNNFSGGSNVAIGYDAKGGKNGSRNVNIGENSVMSENVSDSIAIGSGVGCTESNQIVIGNNAVKSVIIAGIRINFNEDNNINLTGSRRINFSNDGDKPFYIDTTNNNPQIVFPVTLGPEKGTDLIISMNGGMPGISLPFGYDNTGKGITFRAGHIDTPTFTDNSTGKEVMLYPINASEVSELSDALGGESVFGLLTDLAKNSQNSVKTENETPLVKNCIYDLGEQASLTLTLPLGNYSIGDYIQIDFISGSIATTLDVRNGAIPNWDEETGSYVWDKPIGYIPTPEANKLYSLYCEWGRVNASEYGWRVNYEEYPLEV